jgi:ABC-type uncharacterized transport system fused permease/ATPase subunit
MRLYWEMLKENKICTAIGVLCSGAYSYMVYFEYLNLNDINVRWRGYNRVFSSYTNSNGATTCTALAANIFTNRCTYDDNAMEMLSDSLDNGQAALVESLIIHIVPQMLVSVIKLALTFSLQSYLKRKWLEQYGNSQLGLRICYPELAVHARETIDTHAFHYVNGAVERLSMVSQIILAASKINGIYEKSLEFNKEGTGFGLLGFTAQTMCLYFTINTCLSFILGKNAKPLMQAQSEFRNQLTFSMDNPMQIEASQASSKESKLLGNNLITMSKFNMAQEMLNIAITTTSMFFTSYINFAILRNALPVIVMQPLIFFKLQSVSDLISQLSRSLWTSFHKFSESANMGESRDKIINFVHAIEEYAKAMASRSNLTVVRNNSAPLQVSIDIEKRSSDRIAGEKQYLIKNLKKTFIPGKMHGIIGKTGCGKSTFFNILFDIYPFASGNITLPAKENLIYLPQKPIFKIGQGWVDTLFYPLDENDRAALRLNLTRPVKEWVHKLELNEIRARAVKDPLNWVTGLSGGEEQRVALLQALIKIYIRRSKEPNSNIVLLLDESISKLDHELQDSAFDLIKAIVSEKNITALSIDHSNARELNKRYGENIINFNHYFAAKKQEAKMER